VTRTRDARMCGAGIAGVSLIGIALRAIHLDLPMRYDESVTFLSFASRGWEHVTSNYQTPNNHVFHSLLVGWFTAWWGDHPIVIRLPAFVAGCALVPVTAWVGSRVHGAAVGLVAAAFVATSPVLIEFSTNARGYTLVCLCVALAIGIGWSLLRGAGWIVWLAWIEVGVIGAYSIPIMAIPWLGLTGWIGIGRYRARPAGGSPIRTLAPVACATAAIGIWTLLLYSPIVTRQGFDALVGNRFVTAEPMAVFLGGIPREVAGVLGHWGSGIPVPLTLLVVACILLGVRAGQAERDWLLLLTALVAGAVASLALTRNFGEPRVWLWAIPVVAVTAGVGAVEATRRLARDRGAAPALAIAGLWSVAMSLQVVVAGPIRASTETGVFPEVIEVFDGMIRQYRMGDAVIGDFVSVEPIRFYLHRWSATRDVPGRAAMERAWVVLDPRDTARAGQVRDRLARLGVPPLEESRPFLTVGEVSLFLFGRPAGSPDPRLAEAIDWHTGVAGFVDDARALAMVSEVAEETNSPLARTWMARCAATGCMAVRPAGSSPSPGDVETLAEVRELALAGDAEAAFLIGSSLNEGWGPVVDAAEATLWYRRAAGSGHVLAARALGDAYVSGRGVEQSDSAAVEWWRRAADAGDATAQARLGEAYEIGRGVGRDPRQARAWYARSRERGGPTRR